jgi:hypothetical protein
LIVTGNTTEEQGNQAKSGKKQLVMRSHVFKT